MEGLPNLLKNYGAGIIQQSKKVHISNDGRGAMYYG